MTLALCIQISKAHTMRIVTSSAMLTVIVQATLWREMYAVSRIFNHQVFKFLTGCLVRYFHLLFDPLDYISFRNKDCLHNNNIHPLNSNQSNHENCSEWCRNNSNCGGYTLYKNKCYFKNRNCKNNLFENQGRSTFIKQGKVHTSTT